MQWCTLHLQSNQENKTLARNPSLLCPSGPTKDSTRIFTSCSSTTSFHYGVKRLNMCKSWLKNDQRIWKSTTYNKIIFNFLFLYKIIYFVVSIYDPWMQKTMFAFPKTKKSLTTVWERIRGPNTYPKKYYLDWLCGPRNKWKETSWIKGSQ